MSAVYPIAEYFTSINGEGQAAGELSVFIRFTGCNLHCSYCDTRWANEPGAASAQFTAEELCAIVRESGVRNVTLTGGEPLLQKDIAVLIEQLGTQGNRVEIETNGSVPLFSFAQLTHRPVFTMDYKLPSSGMESYMNTDNFALLCPADTVKFVAGSHEDLERARMLITAHRLTRQCHVYLSPVFRKIDPADMVEFMKIHRMNDVRLQLQLHKYIWQPDARGV
ncbi:MAG: putative 7-carboxy-7-deazaguanine synthase QueE [Oscillospiraceae bacterium]|nr:putative 7-carboxy-7-deazaguanine synthase QueE [Oscillospiraceae bacterium]